MAAVDRDALLAQLEVSIPRPRLSPTYRFGILLTAAVLWLLPLLYVGLVALVGYGLYFHATESLVLFDGKGGARWRVAAYVIPLIVGALLLLFMVKPLFAKRSARGERLELDPEREPFVFEFVAAVCRAVGAQPPRRILVDCRVNASAGFHQGGTGLRDGGRELTIGLPLVAGLPLRNLTGVLAHEFGHFSQGTGMRLSMLVVRVQAWFARVVYARDEWDDRIASWSKSTFWYLTATGGLARVFVWITRKILYGLMWISNVVSAYMSRQMEYDADRYQIALVGSEMVGATLRELRLMDVADTEAGHRLGQAWEDRKLVDDLPGLVVQRRKALSEDLVAKVQESFDDEEEHRFSTHPRSIDREEAALALEEPGQFQAEAPATVLFDDFEELCREASNVHFEDLLGREFKKATLLPVAEFVSGVEEEDERHRAVTRYFQGTVGGMRGVGVPSELPAAPEDPRQAGARIRDLRRELREKEALIGGLQDHWIQAYNRLAVLEYAHGLAKVKRKFDPKEFGLDTRDRESVRGAVLAQREVVRQTGEAYESESAGLDERLGLTLAMLQVAAVAGRLDADELVPDGADALREEVSSLLPALGAVQPTLVKCAEIRSQLTVISYLARLIEDDADREKFEPVIRSHAARLRNLAESIREHLGEVPHPFLDEPEPPTIAAWAIPKLSTDRRWQDLFSDAGSAQENLNSLFFRGLARVTWIAERVEAALGMEPMPVPERPASE